MQPFYGKALLAAALVIPASGVMAGETLSESRSVNARVVNVKLDGVINLHVKQGATPSLMLYGDKGMLEKVTVSQQGDTLRINSTKRRFHFGNDQRIRAELTLPNLNEFSSHGVGSAEVRGFSGSDIKLILDGAGSIKFDSNYKHVVARLGGVGSMTLNSGASDKIDLNLRGTGRIAVNGQSKLLHADLSGIGGLDARDLRADAVKLDMSGLGDANVFAHTSANVNLSGLGSVTVHGNPANRQSNARGLGSVSWH